MNGELWDLERPFEKTSKLELFDFDSPEGKRVWWHSSAHILGECAERHYGCHLAIGPPTDDGFFYEMGMTDDRYACPHSPLAQHIQLTSSPLGQANHASRLRAA